MNYEKTKSISTVTIDAFKDKISNPSDEQQARDAVDAARNIAGYEAVFDPDQAVADLGRLVVADALDALNPQLQPKYTQVEGGPHDFLDELAADPSHTFEDAVVAHRAAEASITSNRDGTHTLSWEANPEFTVNDRGEVV